MSESTTTLDPSLQSLGPTLPPCKEGETTDQIIKMRKGKSYLAMDPYLLRLRNRGLQIQQEFNKFPTDNEGRMRFMQGVCGFEEKSEAHRVCVLPGFICEYWFNITFGKEVFAAHNLFIADVAPVHIGSRTMIGPNCQFLTPTHPLSPEERNGMDGPEAAGPIWIGNDVWIGGGVIILANVTIGDGCTVGAGSVVTKSVPPRTVVVGNPARPVKRINADGTTVDIRGEKL